MQLREERGHRPQKVMATLLVRLYGHCRRRIRRGRVNKRWRPVSCSRCVKFEWPGLRKKLWRRRTALKLRQCSFAPHSRIEDIFVRRRGGELLVPLLLNSFDGVDGELPDQCT